MVDSGGVGMTGNLREQMLEQEHWAAFQKIQSGDDRTILSFTETTSLGSRTITRTATVTILANGDPLKAMEFLKQSVRYESASPTP